VDNQSVVDRAVREADMGEGVAVSTDTQIRDVVRRRYGQAALTVLGGGPASCCGADSSCGDAGAITSDLYDSETASTLPEAAIRASLGCGNPTALAELKEGEVVLDLGSGGGIDVLLTARRVGDSGRVYGLDMTDEMLELARRNQKEAGVENVQFLKGHIEEIPLPAESVDVIISNCVINLSADKRNVFREAMRVLRPGGRLAVSDIVFRGEVPAEVRRSLELWIGCVAGALEETEFVEMLEAAGFEDVGIEPTRIYTVEDARSFLAEAGMDESQADQLGGRLMSGFVRAVKPAAADA